MIALGCDHGGYELMQEVKAFLEKKGYEYKDFGCYSTDAVDYPEYGRAAAEAVASGECESGFFSSHSLTDYLDLGIFDDSVKIMDDSVTIGTVGKIPQIQDIFDLYSSGYPAPDGAFIDIQKFDNAASHCSKPQHSSFYHFVCHSFPFCTGKPGKKL